MTPTPIDHDSNIADLTREDFEAAFSAALEEKDIKQHTVVAGTVLGISGDWVMVDVGYKAEGRIALSEFRNPDGLDAEINAGDHKIGRASCRERV